MIITDEKTEMLSKKQNSKGSSLISDNKTPKEPFKYLCTHNETVTDFTIMGEGLGCYVCPSCSPNLIIKYVILA